MANEELGRASGCPPPSPRLGRSTRPAPSARPPKLGPADPTPLTKIIDLNIEYDEADQPADLALCAELSASCMPAALRSLRAWLRNLPRRVLDAPRGPEKQPLTGHPPAGDPPGQPHNRQIGLDPARVSHVPLHAPARGPRRTTSRIASFDG